MNDISPLVPNKTNLANSRNPKCARCKNHGLINELKGHKHVCPWRDCKCEKCQFVIDRQRITACRVASLRQQRKSDFKDKDKMAKSPSSICPPITGYSNIKIVSRPSQSRLLYPTNFPPNLRGLIDNQVDEHNVVKDAKSSSTPSSFSTPCTPDLDVSKDTDGMKENTRGKKTESTADHNIKEIPAKDKFLVSPCCSICNPDGTSLPCRELAIRSQMGQLLQIFPTFPPYLLEIALLDSEGNVSQAVDRILSLMKYYSGYGKASEKSAFSPPFLNETNPHSCSASIQCCSRCGHNSDSIRYCGGCGHKVAPSDNFCSSCGSTLMKKY